MAKDYGKRRPIRQKSSAPKQLFWILASFLAGYLTATVFDFTSLSSWVNANILAKRHEAKPQSQTQVAAKEKEPELPKPKFEFYTLLAKGGNAPVVVPSPKPTASVLTKPVSQPAVAVGNAAAVVPNKQGTAPARSPATIAVTESKPIAPAGSNKDNYQIQIASFKRKQDAEQMKAGLTLKGFDVSVVAVSQSQGTWFRVIVGPFGSRAAAEKAQLSLAQSERVKGMIRKMDA
ncbi:MULTISPECIES: SPOR domain-containing protein [Legionella]|uniref:Sporulation domain-containing protein n=1 Tax=Legionella drozanskii LLAP-1 TaxID=1212489 RepID=A0A0W0SSX2_9GAMM|nr:MULTISPECIES: SPOR domain-containing protein [Legionella]KTC86069.1 Sporulation domain-containing protein [Legionella drozanskii LLAP-1]PJE10581.1 MAG: SPOR domain-containing protein [Legionella sp.]